MAANTRLAVAAHIVCVLASREERYVSSAAIAESVNTNPVVIRRILILLTRRGLVACGRGKAGGSMLSRRPSQISLWDLYIALDQAPLFAVHPNPENPDCVISCQMKSVLTKAFAQAEKAAMERLRRVTIEDLIEWKTR